MCVDSNTPASDDNVTNAGNQGQPQAGNDHAGTKTAGLNLPYFQQGDDLSKYLNDTGNVVEALEVHANQMDLAAAMLRAIGESVTGQNVSVEGNGHHILVTGPIDVIDGLIGEDLLKEEGRNIASRGFILSDWEPIGYVTIDTGQLVLIDPIHTESVTPGLSEEEIAVGEHGTAVVVSTGMGDGNYLVEGRYLPESFPFGPRLAEIRVRFLDEEGNYLSYAPA
jgi:hypothetical protein